jgi:hypothetical protein
MLWGFPYADSNFTALYNLIDGTVLTSNEVTPVNYISKAVEIADTTAQVDLANCANLDINTAFDNATIDPSNISALVTPSVGLTDRPNI